MLPVDIEPQSLILPENHEHKIIVLTGSSLRHKRFAYRLQSEFGAKVVAWYEFTGEALNLKQESSSDKIKNLISLFKQKAAEAYRKGRYGEMLLAPMHVLWQKFRLRSYFGEYTREEQRIFGPEVGRLKGMAHLQPIKITKQQLRSPDFHASVKAMDAYFLLTLGGPIYPKELLECVSGVCINQHAGHSPLYKGSYTTEWALYHRSIEHVSSTVHITVPQADAGPILRRSQPSISSTDHAGTLFCKVVALGTELMIDAVKEIMNSKHIRVYPQPNSGKTYKAKDFHDDIALAIDRDLRHGFIDTALKAQRNY